MAIITISLQFPRADYPSLQVGDIAYYAIIDDEESGGFQINTPTEGLVEIGSINIIDNTTSLSDGTLTTTITCNIDDSTVTPTSSNFILFAKDNKVNMTSLLGYFGSAKFKNNSSDKAELFSVGCEINESSK